MPEEKPEKSSCGISKLKEPAGSFFERCSVLFPEQRYNIGRGDLMIKTIKQQLSEILTGTKECRKLPEDSYSHMKYPKIFSLMDFRVDRYRIEGYGHVMMMHTATKMGMELLTVSFMPSEGLRMPYLLIDAMEMKKKSCVFAEYYGCGENDFPDENLKSIYEQFKGLPDYKEKENWYIRERMPYSLIKSGTEEELVSMSLASARGYLSMIPSAKKDPSYLLKLEQFRTRMIEEGNPSSKTLEMLLKKDGALRFMKEVVMPVDQTE